VGFDCARCHTPFSWLVENITQIHRQSRFPLTGAHVVADCFDCHESASKLVFEPLSVDCFDCHEAEFLTTTDPNHVENEYSTNCIECHNINAYSWSGAGINHSFFPLTQGHDLNDCSQCHNSGEPYNSISPECITCHEQEYQQATNPNHVAVDFSTECNECHTLDRDWRPAEFKNHDNQFFPIYSGKHKGEWDKCTECHTDQNNFTLFSCIDCHEHNQNDMNEEHDDVDGYVYNNQACFECHPTGDSDNIFNHSLSNFPLTGSHITVSCADCHTNSYSGTSTECSNCHLIDFNEAINPNHQTLNLSLGCADCHTTEADWKPATFAIHNEYYLLNGAHQTISNNCFDCHEGNYIETSNLCFGCHADEFNQTTNPPHQAADFSTSCETCHTETAWTPATFDHDNQYFPIYSGNHNGEWESCTECHTTPANYTLFSCIDCHEHNQPDTDSEHNGVGGYDYSSEACFACHPTGDGDDGFNHNLTNFPLTGAHLTTECVGCHANGYTGTTTICSECHQTDYNQSANPSHQSLSLPSTCETCHTTNAGWSPATFPIHNEYYVLNGAHQTISNNCFECHEGNYIETPNLCFGCHAEDYNQTTDPPHQPAGFSTLCETCHIESAWTPATFDHDNQYFPIYSGNHNGEWESCTECHTTPSNYTLFSCIDCHEHNQPDTDSQHNGVGGYSYNSEACYACHPTGDGDDGFNHNLTNFPLTGAHLTTECVGCHANGYAGTTTICSECHQTDYNQSANPSHQSLSLPETCETCHTTNAGWSPATFPIHDNYYVLDGAHQTISNNCFECHEGNYNNTTDACMSCHTSDFNQTTNPNHTALGLPVECESCHTTNPDWNPATFPIHNNYFVLQGAHQTIANQCIACHEGNYNNTPNTCYGCHTSDYNQTTDPPHASAQFPTECEACHTQTAWEPSTFNHDSQYFPIFSGEHQGEWDQCSDCHTNPTNYSIFSCIDCHEHNQSDMASEHRGVPGYSWNSAACFECHPNGEEDKILPHNIRKIN
jgi:hypothetical protein